MENVNCEKSDIPPAEEKGVRDQKNKRQHW